MIDLTLLHPKVVHLPIALAVLMPLLSFGVVVAWTRGWLERRTWVIAFALQLMLVLSGVAAMQTGEVDEERVEQVVPESAVHDHEEAAEAFVWVAAGTLALFLLPIIVRNERTARMVAASAAASTLVVLFLGYRVGELGGALVYEHNAASAFASGSVVEAHDDD